MLHVGGEKADAALCDHRIGSVVSREAKCSGASRISCSQTAIWTYSNQRVDLVGTMYLRYCLSLAKLAAVSDGAAPSKFIS